MRQEKFDNTKPGYETDDIKYAFEHNGLSAHLDNIDVIVAEVCGENDGVDWYWILKMKDGTFAYATGGCDYTGWDCQSNAEIHTGYKTVEEAIDQVVTSEYDHRKNIKQCLVAQVEEKMPFAMYQE